jgi:riboflavin transporter FmnP
MQANLSEKTRYIVFMGVLTLIATVLYFIEIPLFSGYLKLDFSDLPALLAGVMFGPMSGVAVELIKNVFHLCIRGLGDTLGYGNLMNFIVGSAAVAAYSAAVRAALRRGHRRAAFVAAGAAGMAAMVAAGIVGNYLIAPPFFSAMMHVTLTGAALWAAVGAATLLNVIKSAMLAAVAPPVMTALRKYIPAMKE